MWSLEHQAGRLAAATLVAASFLVFPSCGGETPPSSPANDQTQAQLDRGKYLVEIAHCYICHSEVDWNSPGAQPVAGRQGSGGVFPDETLPFRLIVPNISPDAEAGIGAWTDQELDRAIREGIGRDGRRLFPAMPNFSGISDDDLAAVIAYLRSVPAVRNTLPKTEMPEPIKASLPPPNQVARPVAAPDPSNLVARGAYMARIGECAECHTPMTPQVLMSRWRSAAASS